MVLWQVLSADLVQLLEGELRYLPTHAPLCDARQAVAVCGGAVEELRGGGCAGECGEEPPAHARGWPRRCAQQQG
eukprot:1096383-Rhodomonas_salina.1